MVVSAQSMVIQIISNLIACQRILVDIKTELAAVANRVDKIEVTEPAYVCSFHI